MKYLVYLNNKDNDSIVKQSFLMSKNQHFINNSGFNSNFINLIEHSHLPNFDPESLDNDRIGRYTANMKEKYISFWRHSLEHSTANLNSIKFLKMNTLHLIIYIS